MRKVVCMMLGVAFILDLSGCFNHGEQVEELIDYQERQHFEFYV